MTIEEMQMLSKYFLMAAVGLAVLAVILFVRFDIRNIWGLMVKHASRGMYRQGVQVVGSVQSIQTEEKTIPLEQKELGKIEQGTELLELSQSSMHIFQDITYIHTDIEIN